MAAAGWIDTHCHLHRAEFDGDRDAVVQRAVEAGAAALLDPATNLASNRSVVEIARRYPQVYAALGVHPHDARELTDEGLAELGGLAVEEKVAAVGEIGLDYYRDLCPRPVQQAALRKLLRFAHELGKPVILHCRQEEGAGAAGRGGEAYRDLFSILRETLKPPIRGLLHCFSGDRTVAEEGLEMGLTLSFAGNLTFAKADPLRSVAKEVPLERVVLETDAPFLAPQSRRGQRNEPAYLPELVETWAKLKDLTPEDVARVTSVNAYHLFGIGPAPRRGKIAYAIRNSLYLNLTNACTDRCLFCSLSDEEFWKGEGASPFVKGHHLRMARDPSADEVVADAGDPSGYEEIVFCGYGEPAIRLNVLLEVGRRLKKKGARWIRLNTNGHGNLIHRRPIARELKGVVDEVSVSLNTPNAQQYVEICRPVYGLETYDSIKEFIRQCRDEGLKVMATAVAMPGVDVEAIRRVAAVELKVGYRVRTYDDVG